MDVLSRPAEEFANDEVIEQMWAMKAFEHAEIYFNLLCSVNPRELKLTQYDNQIYGIFRQEFPAFNVAVVNEQDMKSPAAKIKWRTFIEKFKMIDCYDFGTLLRVDSSKEFSPDNSLLVIRVEFYAIEIARNREGCNDGLRIKYRPEKIEKSDGSNGENAS